MAVLGTQQQGILDGMYCREAACGRTEMLRQLATVLESRDLAFLKEIFCIDKSPAEDAIQRDGEKIKTKSVQHVMDIKRPQSNSSSRQDRRLHSSQCIFQLGQTRRRGAVTMPLYCSIFVFSLAQTSNKSTPHKRQDASSGSQGCLFYQAAPLQGCVYLAYLQHARF